MPAIKKPLGVTSIAIYSAFGGILGLLFGLFLVIVNSLPKGTSLNMALGALCTALGVFILASVYGLWSL